MVAAILPRGSINTPASVARVERVVVLELEARHVVPTNTLKPHPDSRVRVVIEDSRAAPAYLLPCSPDFHLVEAARTKVEKVLEDCPAAT